MARGKSKEPGHTPWRSFALTKLLKWTNLVLLILILLAQILVEVNLVHFFLTNLPAPGRFFYYDFGAYYIAGSALNIQPDILYDRAGSLQLSEGLQYPTGFSPYIYPPFFAVLFRPIALAPYRAAILIWLFINLTILLFITFETVNLAHFPRRWSSYVIAFLFMVTFWPVQHNLFIFGQVNLIILWSLLMIYRSVNEHEFLRNDLLGGFALAVGLVIKFLLFPVLPYLWLYRRRRIVAVGIGAIALIFLVGLIGGGWINTLRYLTRVIPSLSQLQWTEPLAWINHSLMPTVQRMFTEISYEFQYFFMPEAAIGYVRSIQANQALGSQIGRGMTYILLALTTTTFLVDFLLQRKNQEIEHQDRISLIITVTLLSFPLSWTANHVLILGPMAVLLAKKHTSGLARQLKLFAVLAIPLFLLLNQLWPLLHFLVDRPLSPWILVLPTLGTLSLWMIFSSYIWRDNWPRLATLLGMIRREYIRH